MGRKALTLSINPEHEDKLKKLVETTSMNPSELFQMMIEKVYADDVEQEILMQNFIREYGEKCGKKRLLRIMSIRSMRKKLAAQRASLGKRRSCLTEEHNNPAIEEAQYWNEYCVWAQKRHYTPNIDDFIVWNELKQKEQLKKLHEDVVI